MIINRAYKVELDPTNKQRTAFLKHAGVARFAFNWGLAEWNRLYELGESTDAMKLGKALNAVKKAEFPWMYEVSKCAPQEALKDVEKAYKNFFFGIKANRKVGRPRFKSKHKSKQSWRISSGIMKAGSSWIWLPNIGKVRLKQKDYIPTDQRIRHMIVSELAGRWYVSVSFQQEMLEPTKPTGEIIGVDLGVKTLATCSDGTVYENPKALRAAKAKLRRLNKELSRRQKGSSNRRKTKQKLARVHARVSNIRSDAIHKMTSDIVRTKRPSLIVIETLNVKGMTKNHKLAGAVLDASFSEVRRQLQYKCSWYGSGILLADQWFPSSKTCSKCDCIKDDLTLNDRTYKCKSCNNVIDRDLNAALNLKKYGELELTCTASSAGRACGDGVRPALTGATVRETGSKHQLTLAALVAGC